MSAEFRILILPFFAVYTKDTLRLETKYVSFRSHLHCIASSFFPYQILSGAHGIVEFCSQISFFFFPFYFQYFVFRFPQFPLTRPGAELSFSRDQNNNVTSTNQP